MTTTDYNYTTSEIMTIAAARLLKNGAVCFVGIGLPSTAANCGRNGGECARGVRCVRTARRGLGNPMTPPAIANSHPPRQPKPSRAG